MLYWGKLFFVKYAKESFLEEINHGNLDGRKSIWKK